MRTLFTLILFSFIFLFPSETSALQTCVGAPTGAPQSVFCYGDPCSSSRECPIDATCTQDPAVSTPFLICQPITGVGATFGKVLPPAQVERFGFGSAGISKFLNNLITLIYMISGVAFVLLIIWSGVEWITSGGDKEKVASAQRRLTYAFIGMGVLAIAFALISVFGTFTGFKFF